MKTVKEICLGVAVAGVVVGAGTTVACAVASAETGTDGGNGAARSAGPSKPSATRQAARVRPTGAVPNAASVSSSRSVPSGAASRVTATSARSSGAAALAPFSTAPSTPTSLLSTLPVLSAGSAPAQRAAAAVTASAVGSAGPTKVLLIGTDGTNLSKVLANPANTGFFNLMNQSVTGATSLVGHTTLSGPSWTTILTGVWDTKSGVFNNIFNPAPYDKWPTVFNQLEAYDPTIRTSIVADWKYLNDLAAAGAYPADSNTYYELTDSWAATDTQVVNKTIDLINATSANSPAFIFSYQAQVDEAGHSFGGGSPEYAEAVTNVSDNIAQIMAAVDAYNLGKPVNQQWSVIVTTDHGHQQSVGFGHGFQSPNETSSFVIFDQAGNTSNDGWQNLNYSTADVTPTIVSLFGAPLRSDFDGVPINQDSAVLNSLVRPVSLNSAAPGGALNQTLTDAINSFGYPNIGTDIKLGIRTVFGAVPYFINIAVTAVSDQLNSLAAQNIFLLSPIAAASEFLVSLVGGAVVNATNWVAQVVGYLTGAGTVAPNDPPLSSVPSTDALLAAGALPVL